MAKFEKGKSGNPNGRPAGAKNKVSEELREAMSDFLQGEFNALKTAVSKLNPKERMRFFVDCLPFVLPKLQSTSLQTDFERIPDDQLDEIIERLKTEAVNAYDQE